MQFIDMSFEFVEVLVEVQFSLVEEVVRLLLHARQDHLIFVRHQLNSYQIKMVQQLILLHLFLIPNKFNLIPNKSIN